MKSHAIAIRLFEHLDLDPALTGDLLEERARGRSAFWYWRQVLLAAWIGIWSAVRDHKVLALRAVATGFALEYFFAYLWGKFYPLPQWLDVSIQEWTVALSMILLSDTALGWLVARTHRTRKMPMVLVFTGCSLIWFFGPAVVNLAIATAQWNRIDPVHRPLLLLYDLSVFLEILITLVFVPLGGILARRPKPMR